MSKKSGALKDTKEAKSTSESKHVVNSARDKNVPPKVKRTIFWAAGIFIVVGLIVAFLNRKGTDTKTSSSANFSSETSWIKSQVDMPAHQVGTPVYDGSTMACIISDTPLRFEAVCRNKWAVEDFNLLKSEGWGKWQRRNSKVGGRFSVAKVPGKNKYLGECYSDTDVPAPFEMTPSS